MKSHQNLWRLTPWLDNHNFVENGRQFRYERGALGGWALVAPEKGSFLYEVEGERGEATFGDLVISRPNVEWWRKIQGSLTYHSVEFHWRDGCGNKVIPDEMPVGKISLRNTGRLVSNFQELRAYAGLVDDWSTHHKSHILRDILQIYYGEVQRVASITSLETSDKTMKCALQLLQEKAGESFNMKTVSDELGLSPVQFTRRFQQEFGILPSEHLTALRLGKARRLLQETDWTLERIAHQCGYKNAFYLSRVFSQGMKMSPNHFRKTQKLSM